MDLWDIWGCFIIKTMSLVDLQSGEEQGLVGAGLRSVPLAILLFANVYTDMPLDFYVKYWWLGAVILWIAIPGLVSGVFYYKK